MGWLCICVGEIASVTDFHTTLGKSIVQPVTMTLHSTKTTASINASLSFVLIRHFAL